MHHLHELEGKQGQRQHRENREWRLDVAAARDEVIALAGSHVPATPADQQIAMPPQDLHRTEGPARALFLEVQDSRCHAVAIWRQSDCASPKRGGATGGLEAEAPPGLVDGLAV